MLKPKIERQNSDIKHLVPPEDCDASVLLKRVMRDGKRCYWWCVAVTKDVDITSASYVQKPGEETIRFDLPKGFPVSAAAIHPYLREFLGMPPMVAKVDDDPLDGGDPPIIINRTP